MKRNNLLLIAAMVLIVALGSEPALAGKTLIKTQSIYPTRMPIGGEVLPLILVMAFQEGRQNKYAKMRRRR